MIKCSEILLHKMKEKELKKKRKKQNNQIKDNNYDHS